MRAKLSIYLPIVVLSADIPTVEGDTPEATNIGPLLAVIQEAVEWHNAHNGRMAGFRTPEPVIHRLDNLTNQGVINLYNLAFGPRLFWDVLTRTGLAAALVTSRNAQYSGPAVENMPGLTEAEKAKLIDTLESGG